jgi:hypothetical protein
MAAAMLAPTPPTLTPSTFGEFLSIAPNDHYAGNYTALMQKTSPSMVPLSWRSAINDGHSQAAHE